jgi:peptidyl-prolyl cis-trans isomerase C
MKLKTPAARAALLIAVASLCAPLVAQAQNITTVNGKAVPKARVDTLLGQAQRSGQAITPELQAQAREQVVLREIFVQEAARKGMAASPDVAADGPGAREHPHPRAVRGLPQEEPCQ